MGVHPQRRCLDAARQEARRQRRCGKRLPRHVRRVVRRRQYRHRGWAWRQPSEPFGRRAAGAAWVFTRSGGVWTQQGDNLVSTGAMERLGTSVALSADGNIAIVGGLPKIRASHWCLAAAAVTGRRTKSWLVPALWESPYPLSRCPPTAA